MTTLHHCCAQSKSGGYGGAVDVCFETDDSELWVGNGEYASQVNFCPWCGYEAKVKVTVEITNSTISVKE